MATTPSHTRQRKYLAVLIETNNASAAIVESLFEEISNYQTHLRQAQRTQPELIPKQMVGEKCHPPYSLHI